MWFFFRDFSYFLINWFEILSRFCSEHYLLNGTKPVGISSSYLIYRFKMKKKERKTRKIGDLWCIKKELTCLMYTGIFFLLLLFFIITFFSSLNWFHSHTKVEWIYILLLPYNFFFPMWNDDKDDDKDKRESIYILLLRWIQKETMSSVCRQSSEL